MNFDLYIEELFRQEDLLELDAEEIMAVLRNPSVKRVFGLAQQEITGKQRQLEGIDFSQESAQLTAAKIQGVLIGLRRVLEIFFEATEDWEADSSQDSLFPEGTLDVRH